MQGCGAAEAVPSCGFGDTRHQRVLAEEQPHAGVSRLFPEIPQTGSGDQEGSTLPGPAGQSLPPLFPQMMTAPTPSRPTKWPGCIATWTWCTSAGARARSLHPSRSLPWSRGRRRTLSVSTGCLPSVVSYMRGKGSAVATVLGLHRSLLEGTRHPLWCRTPPSLFPPWSSPAEPSDTRARLLRWPHRHADSPASLLLSGCWEGKPKSVRRQCQFLNPRVQSQNEK